MWKSRRIYSAQDYCRRWRDRNRPGLRKHSSKATYETGPAYDPFVDEEEEKEVEKSRLVSRGRKDTVCRISGCKDDISRPMVQTGKAAYPKNFHYSSYFRSHCNSLKRKFFDSLKGGVMTCFHCGFPVKEEKIDVPLIYTHLCDIGIHVEESILRSYRAFSLQELSMATSNFGTDNVLRTGSAGSVYRGLLASTGETIAVKVLNSRLKDARLSFGRELEMLYRVHHDNIQSLLGYCFEDDNLLLVSSYMSRGSVDYWLHDDVSAGRHNQHKLSWDDRQKIAVGIAKALHYLHTECNPPIIHRDVKPANILLSAYNEAKASLVLDGTC